MRVISIALAFCILLLASSARAGAPVELSYFGLHIHRSDQGSAWPAVPFGSWRLWDAGASWDRIEPQPGKWDFQRLDRYVAMAELAHVDVIFELTNTPQWASARPNEPSGYKPGNASEPANMAYWDRYVRTVGERYKGRIHYYELWNEPDDKNHFTGSLSTLVDMSCRAYRILKEIDPSIRIISPGHAGGGGHIAHLDSFLAAGGKACIDIVAHHFYVPRYGPEAMVEHIRQVKNVMLKNGIADRPLWNTETGWWFENQTSSVYGSNVTRGGWRLMSLTESADSVAKALLIARGEGVERFYWYAWDNSNFGFIEPMTGTLKPAALAWKKTVETMLGKSVEPCRIIAGEWRCALVDKNGIRTQVTWPDSPAALTPREGSGAYAPASQIRWSP